MISELSDDESDDEDGAGDIDTALSPEQQAQRLNSLVPPLAEGDWGRKKSFAAPSTAPCQEANTTRRDTNNATASFRQATI